MRTNWTSCKIASDCLKNGHKIIGFHCFIILIHRWKAQCPIYVGLLSSFKDISSLPTQSQHKFGKKSDSNFNVYLMLNLPQLRNSLRDLYMQHTVEKRRFLAFQQCKTVCKLCKLKE